MTVAVIIPARDASNTLGEVLAALAREGVPGPNRVLIVVDDASIDTTAQIAQDGGAVVLHGTGAGPGAARNLGARHTEAQVLVFLDADAAPQPGWLDALLAPLADPDVVAVKGRYVSHQRGLVPRFAQLEFEEKYARLRRASTIDFVDTGTAAYRHAAFDEVGGFDESFPAQSAEDVDLAFRLSERGARFAYADDARVEHRHAQALIDFLTKKARYGFFRAKVYRRFPSKMGGDSYTPRWMAVQIALAGAIPVVAVFEPRLARMNLLYLLIAGFALSCRPLFARALTHDRGLLFWVMPLAYARAFAQGVGLAAGLIYNTVTHIRGRSS